MRGEVEMRVADAEPPIGPQVRVAPGVVHEAVVPAHQPMAERRAGGSGGVVQLRRGVGVLEFAAPVVVPVPTEEQSVPITSSSRGTELIGRLVSHIGPSVAPT